MIELATDTPADPATGLSETDILDCFNDSSILGGQRNYLLAVGRAIEAKVLAAHPAAATQAAQPVQEPAHRPSQEWYANMIAATLDDDFSIGQHTAAAQPIYWRHRKTGGVYRLVGHAQLQTDSPLVDMAHVIVYQGEDGKLWARASGECGSRFDRVSTGTARA